MNGNSYPVPFPSHHASAFGEDQYGFWQDILLANVATRFRWVAPGEFMMGSAETEKGRYDDEVQHHVTISSGYWLAQTACTQRLWSAVTGEQPSQFTGDDLPVESISWDDIQRLFITPLKAQLSDLEPLLPTEAQWEYACRAGTETAFSWGEEIDESLAKYNGVWSLKDAGEYVKGLNSMEQRGEATTVPVDRYHPNPWGFYQMHGNVWEWCSDWFSDYPNKAGTDPEGSVAALNEGERVLRGGSWYNDGRLLRSAFRDSREPGIRLVNIGFRLAQVPVSQVAEPPTRSVPSRSAERGQKSKS